MQLCSFYSSSSQLFAAPQHTRGVKCTGLWDADSAAVMAYLVPEPHPPNTRLQVQQGASFKGRVTAAGHAVAFIQSCTRHPAAQELAPGGNPFIIPIIGS